MNEEELDAWEQSIGFVSLRTVINNIYKEKMLYEDFNDMELINEYPEIFTINNGNVGPIVFSSIDQAVRNSKGEYFFQNVLNIKNDRGTLHILNPDEQNIDELVKSKTFSEKDGVIYIEDDIEIIEVRDKSCVQTNDEGNGYHYLEYKKGENNDGDRRVYMYFYSERRSEYLNGGGNFTFLQHYYVEWKVFGKKYSFFKWRDYATNLHVNNAKFSLYAPQIVGGISDTWNDFWMWTYFTSETVNVSNNDVYSIVRKYWPGHAIKCQNIIAPPRFTRTNGEVWSRGVPYNNRIDCSTGVW